MALQKARAEGRRWVGTSGYVYPGWRGKFYPAELPVSRQLEFAGRIFQSIEINRSFYSLLSPAACLAWVRQTPPGFVFALKGSRFITHNKKLCDVEQALANFLASGPLALEDKLGPIVWQLPATMKFDAERLAAFLSALPRTTRAAAQLAKKHDERVKHGAYLEVERDRPLRYVLEARHESFLGPECASILRDQAVALAVSDSPGWRSVEEPTTDFMYFRLHGSERLYASQYTSAELESWALHVRTFQKGGTPRDAPRISSVPAPRAPRDVYVYFDNDAQAFAAKDAQRLMALLSAAEPKGARARVQGAGSAT